MIFGVEPVYSIFFVRVSEVGSGARRKHNRMHEKSMGVVRSVSSGQEEGRADIVSLPIVDRTAPLRMEPLSSDGAEVPAAERTDAAPRTGEERKSFREIGEQKRLAFLSSIGEGFGRVRQGIRGGMDRVGGLLAKGAAGAARLGDQAIGFAVEAPRMAKDAAVNAVDTTIGAAMSAYEGLERRAQEAYRNAWERDRAGKQGFRDVINDIRMKILSARERVLQEKMAAKVARFQGEIDAIQALKRDVRSGSASSGSVPSYFNQIAA